MKAKPWEKNRQVDTNLTAQIQQNSSNLPPLNLTDTANMADLNSGLTNGPQLPSTTTNSTTDSLLGTSTTGTLGTNSSTMGGYGSTMGGYGSSMGGYGSSMYGSGYGSSMYGGGYGSSMYGGGYGSSMYGGYGSSMYGGYGSGMYGGMGRFGMMGNNGDPNSPNFMQNSMMFLNSFGFVIQAMGEIARTIEMNAQGLVHLFQSMFNLGIRMKGWGVDFINFVKNMFKKIYQKVVEFIQSKGKVLFMGDQQNNVKMRMRIVQTTLRIFLVMFIVSMIPLLKNMMKGDANEAIFSNLQNQM